MSGYGQFSKFYDRLTTDVDYPARADYLLSLFALHGDKIPETLLDLACGSGSLTVQMAGRGIEMIGVDASEDMLAMAVEKSSGIEPRILFLAQDMRELDLYGTVNGAACILDSLNHLRKIEDVLTVFQRLHLFIEPDGLLIFDVNTPYKHRQVLGDNAFVFEEEDFVCVWRNHFLARTCEVDMLLDFFVNSNADGYGDYYERMTDTVRERAYTPNTLQRLLKQAGFETLAIYGDMTTLVPTETEERMVFVAKRTAQT